MGVLLKTEERGILMTEEEMGVGSGSWGRTPGVLEAAEGPAGPSPTALGGNTARSQHSFGLLGSRVMR